MSVTIGPVTLDISTDHSDPENVTDMRRSLIEQAHKLEPGSEARMILMTVVGAMSPLRRSEPPAMVSLVDHGSRLGGPSPFKFMGMNVEVHPDMPASAMMLVNCAQCMDYGLVHLGPNMDLCPAVGCTARSQWVNTGRGWIKRERIG